MQDQRTRESTARVSAAAIAMAPSSSRMLASYLADVEQLLDEQQWERALREASDLPLIAVALSDSQLRISHEGLQSWCDEWIRPEDPDSNANGTDYARVSGTVLARFTHDEAASVPLDEAANVPLLALKRLRLRRHARTAPRGFNSDRRGNLAPEGNNAVVTCTILVEAVRRWYAQSACHDPVVQANLARLAVLR
ncbi:MAG TPA: hypothetical protein VHB68_00805 [Steroidobacteraceae bacterium]|nr:hypothetical protein [Steroidobacteraceae bacterium]